MRFIHVARRFTPSAWGGTEAVVTALVREQRKAGHEADVLSTAALDRPGRDEVLGIPVRRFGYTYGRWPLSAGSRNALDRKGGNPLSAGILRTLLTEPGVDVIHCHTMQRLAGQVRWAARRRGIPYVVQLHGGEFRVPEAEVREMLAPTRRSFDWGKGPSAILGTRRFLADADLVLVLSREEEEAGRHRLPGVRIERLPNGVDPGRFTGGDGTRARERWGIPEGAPLLLTVARVDPQKGQLLLPEVLASCPAAHAVAAGPTTVPGYDEKVIARAREMGVAARLHLTGGLPPETAELADLYRAADLFVLPSTHEPFGIVVLEAWATGLAVVASRVGGLGELVRDGVDGLLVPPADGPALAGAVAALLGDPLRRTALAAAGREEVLARYTWPAVAARLEGLYSEILERRRP
jgi:glycosyltransferase involved in cell wall biosynthesis